MVTIFDRASIRYYWYRVPQIGEPFFDRLGEVGCNKYVILPQLSDNPVFRARYSLWKVTEHGSNLTRMDEGDSIKGLVEGFLFYMPESCNGKGRRFIDGQLYLIFYDGQCLIHKVEDDERTYLSTL